MKIKDDPHDYGWPGVAMEIIGQALYEGDYYFIQHPNFEFWRTIALNGKIDVKEARDAIERRVN